MLKQMKDGANGAVRVTVEFTDRVRCLSYSEVGQRIEMDLPEGDYINIGEVTISPYRGSPDKTTSIILQRISDNLEFYVHPSNFE